MHQLLDHSMPLPYAERICRELNLSLHVYPIHQSIDETCQKVLQSHPGEFALLKEGESEFLGMTFFKQDGIDLIMLSHHDWGVPASVFFHELGHVAEFFQITNRAGHIGDAISYYHLVASKMCKMLGESEYVYLMERTADYYAILLSAMLDIRNQCSSDYLAQSVEQFEYSASDSPAAHVLSELYLHAHEPQTSEQQHRFYLYIAQRIRTTGQLYLHVNHCFKYVLLTQMLGYRKSMEHFYPYIRDFHRHETPHIRIIENF